MLTHGKLLAADAVMLLQRSAFQDRAPGIEQILAADQRQTLDRQLRNVNIDRLEIAPELRHGIEIVRGQLHLLVFQQATHQLGAWIKFDALLHLFRARQQHARLDLDQHRRHDQIFRRQLQPLGLLKLAHDIDISHVLHGQRRHVDVEHIQVVAADQPEQQIERPLEGFQNHFQRIRRNVQIGRQIGPQLALHLGEMADFLLGCVGGFEDFGHRYTSRRLPICTTNTRN